MVCVYSGNMENKRKKKPEKFVCHVCDKVFTRQKNLNRHIQRHVNVDQHNCPDCGKVFSRGDALLRHRSAVHNKKGSDEKRKAVDIPPHQPVPKKLKQTPRRFL